MYSIPRIIILDNDETTGSYTILFYLYEFFAKASVGRQLHPEKYIPIFARLFTSYSVFRPGLHALLANLYNLKQTRKIDNVVVYTNQLDQLEAKNYFHELDVWINVYSYIESVPNIICRMFDHIVEDDSFIDYYFARPIHPPPLHIGPYIRKDLSRVYKGIYPHLPVNLTHTRIIDDLAAPQFIVDSSSSNTDKRSHIRITPYRRKLPEDAFFKIITFILADHRIIMTVDDLLLFNRINTEWQRDNAAIRQEYTPETLSHLIDIASDIHHQFRDRRYSTLSHSRGHRHYARQNKRTKAKRRNQSASATTWFRCR